MTKYIVVAGGVMSGVGKGVTSASIAKILKEHGHHVSSIKIDPYINYDAGTLRPTEHGEVWVTDDGGEIDQDLGTYERFLDMDIPKQNNMTTGQIYKTVIDRERKGEYLGETVQFIPHIPNEIIRRIKLASKGTDICVIEIGGTIGDHENIPFLFAVKALERELGKDSVCYVLVTYLPVPGHIEEMKTKPTQQAIKLLTEEGIFPDFIICRAKRALDKPRKKKIEVYANINSDHVISEPDIESVYQIPLDLEQEKLGEKILTHLGMKTKKAPDWKSWSKLVKQITDPKHKVRVGIVGKYIDIGDYSLTDSYVSISQSLIHAGASLNTQVDIIWLDAKTFEKDDKELKKLNELDGIIVPGGFGNSGVEGKIKTIKFAREHNIPYLGLCYGLQLATVEYARHVAGLTKANTVEVDPKTPHKIIDILESQKKAMSEHDYGGTMRLGAYAATLKEGSQVHKLYKEWRLTEDQKRVKELCGQKEHTFRCGDLDTSGPVVLERHRHRYEVNPEFITPLEENGLVFSGFHTRKDGTKLVEFIELPSHPYFVATQSHPEFKSRMGNPAPLFYGFVKACGKK